MVVVSGHPGNVLQMGRRTVSGRRSESAATTWTAGVPRSPRTIVRIDGRQMDCNHDH